MCIRDRDFVVSDNKPDLNRILTIDGKVVISGKEAVQDRVVVEGTVSFTVLYISCLLYTSRCV